MKFNALKFITQTICQLKKMKQSMKSTYLIKQDHEDE